MFCEYNIQKKRPSFKPASESLSLMRKYADISIIARLLFPISGFLIKISPCVCPLYQKPYGTKINLCISTFYIESLC